MKAILLAIRPEWVAKILNGEKTIEVRKLFPKDYVGWVYFYCSKSKPYLQKGFFYNDFDQQGGECYGLFKKPQIITEKDYTRFDTEVCELMPNNNLIDEFAILSEPLNGKVVARFWCDKVEEVFTPTYICEDDNYYSCDEYEVLKKSCLTEEQVFDYIGEDNYHFFAIHISKLEIFDRPRKLSEYEIWCNEVCNKCKHLKMYKGWTLRCHKPALTKAPQNYCYVEVE